MKTAIIDLDSIAYVIGHPNKILGTDGEPIKQDGKFVYQDKTEDELRASTDAVMHSILKESGATHYIAFIKGRNTTRDRLHYNSEYKANRNKEEPSWWLTVAANLARWNSWQVDNIEVDDAVNITRLKIPNSFICAVDGDLLKLEGTHYNWKKKEWVVTGVEEAAYKFWEDMIAGQTVDNVKGIPGKGPAFASKLLLNKPTKLNSREFATAVLAAYIDHFGELKGIKEYMKNYFSLKVLDEYPGFYIPMPTEYKPQPTIPL